MRDRISNSEMPRFWPPRQSRFWIRALRPLQRYILHHHHKIDSVSVEGMAHLQQLPPGDSAIICPNHSYTGDGSVMMEVSCRAPRPFHFMAAWHVFRGHMGIDGWLLQRMGGFSVDREGADRQAIRQAVELLGTGKFLVVFPEGEIYHLNDRLTPLREGVAFMAVSAQRDLDKGASQATVWLVPARINYEFMEDIQPGLISTMDEMERRLSLRSRQGIPLHERIVRFGEFMLTIKEKEKLGHSNESMGDLPTRLRALITAMLEELETAHLKSVNSQDSVPLRVKSLRRQLLENLYDDSVDGESKQAAREALADVHLIVQLFSYPGDYIASKPTAERMGETVEKFREDLDGSTRPIGTRQAKVILGEPISVRARMGSGRARTVATDLTSELEDRMQRLISK